MVDQRRYVAFVAPFQDRPTEDEGLREQVAVVRRWWLGDPQPAPGQVSPTSGHRPPACELIPPPMPGACVTPQDFDRLKYDLGEVAAGSVVALYVSGHGKKDEEDESKYLLQVNGGDRDPRDLARELWRSPAKHSLVVVDSCHADLLAGPLKDVFRVARSDGGDNHRPVVVVTGDRSKVEDQTGLTEFSGILARAVALLREEKASISTSEEFLSPNDLSWALREAFPLVAAKVVPTIVLPLNTETLWDEPSAALPNPAYKYSPRADNDLVLTDDEIEYWLDRDYWINKASGASEGDRAWYFTGRKPVMRQIVSWLQNSEGPQGIASNGSDVLRASSFEVPRLGVPQGDMLRQSGDSGPSDGGEDAKAATSLNPFLIVTGARGTGKSAVLGRAVTLADPAFCREYPDVARGVTSDLMPPPRSIDAAVDARGRSLDRLVELLLDQLGETGAGPAANPSSSDTRRRGARAEDETAPRQRSLRERLADGLTSFAAHHGDPACVVVDGIDEASATPQSMVHEVLAALALTRQPDGRPAARAVVGVRDDETNTNALPLIASLRGERGDPAWPQTVRTDADDDFRGEVSQYCVSLLSRARSPYRVHPDQAEQVADLIARQDPPRFLDARIVGEALSSRPTTTDLASLGDDPAAAVLRQTLDLAAWPVAPDAESTAEDQQAALIALAFARGAGTPWRDVWPTLASAVFDRDITDQAITDLLRGPLGPYVMTATEDHQRVFRPVHDTVRLALRANLTDTWRVEARIAARLSALAPADDTPPDPYLRRHLVEHAKAGGVLIDKVIPECFLPWDTSRAVRGALGMPLPKSEDTRVLVAWAAVEPFLDQIPTVAERRIALQVQLLSPVPASSGWRSWLIDRNVLLAAPGLQSIAIGKVGAREFLAVGSRDGIRLWDSTAARPVGPLIRHTGAVHAVAFGKIGDRSVVAAGDVSAIEFGHADGRPVLAAIGWDGTARLLDPVNRRLVRRIGGRYGVLKTIAFGQVGNRPVLATADRDGTVRLLDPANGRLVRKFRTAAWAKAMAFWRVSGRTVLVVASGGGDIHLLDPSTGHFHDYIRTWHISTWQAAAFGQVRDQMLLAAASDDGTVRLWDPISQPVELPLTRRFFRVEAVAFGRFCGRPLLAVAGGGGTIDLWDPATGQPAGRLPDVWSTAAQGMERRNWSRMFRWRRSGAPEAMAFGRVGDQPCLAIAHTDGKVRLWNSDTGQLVGKFGASHVAPWRTIAFGQVGDRVILAVASEDGTIYPWDPTTGRLVREPFVGGSRNWLEAVAFWQVGGQTFLAVARGRVVDLWDVFAGRQVGSFSAGHAGYVRDVAFGKIGSQAVLATCGDRTIRLWDLAAGRLVGVPVNLLDEVHGLAFSSGGLLAVATPRGVAVLTPEFLAGVVKERL